MFKRRHFSTISQSNKLQNSKPTFSALHQLNQQITDEAMMDIGIHSSVRSPIISGSNVRRGSNQLLMQNIDTMQTTGYHLGQITPLQIGDRHFQMQENNMGKTLPQFEQQSQRITEESLDNNYLSNFQTL